jgi:hypothetical protein
MKPGDRCVVSRWGGESGRSTGSSFDYDQTRGLGLDRTVEYYEKAMDDHRSSRAFWFGVAALVAVSAMSILNR